MRSIALIILFGIAGGGGCTKAQPPPPPRAAPGTAGVPTPVSSAHTHLADPQQDQKLIARGKIVYRSNCISCHNLDPRKPGSVGPELAGSDLSILEAQVVLGQYPPGRIHRSKANIKMPPLPQLKNELEALHAYLNSDLN